MGDDRNGMDRASQRQGCFLLKRFYNLLIYEWRFRSTRFTTGHSDAVPNKLPDDIFVDLSSYVEMYMTTHIPIIGTDLLPKERRMYWIS